MGTNLNRTLERGHNAEVFGDSQRHRILDILNDASEPMGIADLARDLARQEMSKAKADECEVAKQYHIELYHKHVPKLANADYITFDREQRTVTLGSNAPDEALDELMDLHN